MPTDSTTVQYKTSAGIVSQADSDETGDTRRTYSPTVAASTTDFHVAVSVDVSALISFLIYSDQALTMKTNSSSSPDQTLSLEAGVALSWTERNLEDNPLTTDMTNLYFTNAGTKNATVQMSFLQS